MVTTAVIEPCLGARHGGSKRPPAHPNMLCQTIHITIHRLSLETAHDIRISRVQGGDPITITEFHLMSLVRYEWNLLGGVAATRGMVVAA